MARLGIVRVYLVCSFTFIILESEKVANGALSALRRYFIFHSKFQSTHVLF